MSHCCKFKIWLDDCSKFLILCYFDILFLYLTYLHIFIYIYCLFLSSCNMFLFYLFDSYIIVIYIIVNLITIFRQINILLQDMQILILCIIMEMLMDIPIMGTKYVFVFNLNMLIFQFVNVVCLFI